ACARRARCRIHGAAAQLDVARCRRTRALLGGASRIARLSHAVENRFYRPRLPPDAQRLVRIRQEMEGRDGPQNVGSQGCSAIRTVCRFGGRMTSSPILRNNPTRVATQHRELTPERTRVGRGRALRPNLVIRQAGAVSLTMTENPARIVV